MFSRRGKSDVEVKRAASIKKNLTSTFARATRSLQQQHIVLDCPIYRYVVNQIYLE